MFDVKKFNGVRLVAVTIIFHVLNLEEENFSSATTRAVGNS